MRIREDTLVSIIKLEPKEAVRNYAYSQNSEEDAWNPIVIWAREEGLFHENSGCRFFGRNVYPTKDPNPHGYEIFLTIPGNLSHSPKGELELAEFPGGKFAMLRITGIEQIQSGWQSLSDWVQASNYAQASIGKISDGWVLGFEERVDWYNEDNPYTEWVFNLMLPLKE